MSQSFHDAGLKLAANIKPCLLQDHPRYGEVAERGLFIRDSQTDAPERSSFWDDEGSHLDFTNPQTVAWWQEGVTTQLLEMGIDSTGTIITNTKYGTAKPAATALAVKSPSNIFAR